MIKPQQQAALGVDQPPQQRESNGRQVCRYQHGKAGTPGWGFFVGIDTRTSFKHEVGRRSKPDEFKALQGYPVAEYENSIGCTAFVEIADNGYLIVNGGRTSTVDAGVDLCEQAEALAEAALTNLPNA